MDLKNLSQEELQNLAKEVASEIASRQMPPEKNLYTARLEMGAMLDCPAYESHKRGKNWCAKISKNPAAPNGLDRQFAPRGHGEYYYILPTEWGPGTPIEVGADYYSCGGNASRDRWYGRITERTDAQVVFEVFPSATLAINGGNNAEKI